MSTQAKSKVDNFALDNDPSVIVEESAGKAVIEPLSPCVSMTGDPLQQESDSRLALVGQRQQGRSQEGIEASHVGNKDGSQDPIPDLAAGSRLSKETRESIGQVPAPAQLRLSLGAASHEKEEDSVSTPGGKGNAIYEPSEMDVHKDVWSSPSSCGGPGPIQSNLSARKAAAAAFPDEVKNQSQRPGAWYKKERSDDEDHGPAVDSKQLLFALQQVFEPGSADEALGSADFITPPDEVPLNAPVTSAAHYMMMARQLDETRARFIAQAERLERAEKQRRGDAARRHLASKLSAIQQEVNELMTRG